MWKHVTNLQKARWPWRNWAKAVKEGSGALSPRKGRGEKGSAAVDHLQRRRKGKKEKGDVNYIKCLRLDMYICQR